MVNWENTDIYKLLVNNQNQKPQLLIDIYNRIINAIRVEKTNKDTLNSKQSNSDISTILQEYDVISKNELENFTEDSINTIFNTIKNAFNEVIQENIYQFNERNLSFSEKINTILFALQFFKIKTICEQIPYDNKASQIIKNDSNDKPPIFSSLLNNEKNVKSLLKDAMIEENQPKHTKK